MKKRAILVGSIWLAFAAGCIVEDERPRERREGYREERREERHEERVREERREERHEHRACPHCGGRVEWGVTVCGSCGRRCD